ncbi:hypothetical protein AURDEDRAFT_145513 [Auricularia subglabra TFB-10046 SS5]|nr:hypothetical protein AURDEDRAFT_145513 [Auricularia subglabra TFB-10046 SS5]
MSAHGAAPALDLTFGVVELGTSFSMLLLGVGLLQAWNYFRTFPDDNYKIKTLVIFVMIADILHSAFLMHTTYHYTITSFANFKALGDAVWSLVASVFTTGAIAFAVQGYYCQRVLRMTGSYILAIGCAVLSVFRLVMNICLIVTIQRSMKFAVTQTPTFKWQITALMTVGAASDIAIALCICIALLRTRSGFAATNKLVDKIVAFTVGSGLLTSVTAVVLVITYLTMNNFVFLLFHGVLSKLFTNSLFASLNERAINQKTLMSWDRQPSYSMGTVPTTNTRMDIDRRGAPTEIELATHVETFHEPEKRGERGYY